MWIGVSLLVTAGSATEAHRARRAALIALAAAALLLAHATKETSLVVIPISLGWLAVERWSSRERGPCTRFAATYVAINVVAAAAFIVLRSYYSPLGLAEGTYTRAYTLNPAVVGAALFRISAWLVRDFAFLLPLLAATIPSLLGGRPGWRRPGPVRVRLDGGLARRLPAVAGDIRVLPAPLCVRGRRARRHGRRRRLGLAKRRHSATRRRVAWSVLVASGLLWLVAIVNAVADARVQLTVDRSNSDLVDFLAALPSRSRVVLNTGVNEYLFELPMHLSQIKRRSDIVVEHRTRMPPDGPSSADVFVVTAEMANKPGPTVRVALDEPGVRHDNAVLNAMLTAHAERVYRAAQHTHARRAWDPPTPLPCHREPGHRPYLLPDRSRGGRQQDVLVRMAGPPAGAAGDRPCGDPT